MIRLEMTLPKVMRTYIALLREQQRHRVTIADLLARGVDPDSLEVRIIEDALAETHEALRVVDTALYPAPARGDYGYTA